MPRKAKTGKTGSDSGRATPLKKGDLPDLPAFDLEFPDLGDLEIPDLDHFFADLPDMDQAIADLCADLGDVELDLSDISDADLDAILAPLPPCPGIDPRLVRMRANLVDMLTLARQGGLPTLPDPYPDEDD